MTRGQTEAIARARHHLRQAVEIRKLAGSMAASAMLRATRGKCSPEELLDYMVETMNEITSIHADLCQVMGACADELNSLNKSMYDPEEVFGGKYV